MESVGKDITGDGKLALGKKVTLFGTRIGIKNLSARGAIGQGVGSWP